MFQMHLLDFTHDESFPFFIQFGQHDDELFMHAHENFSELVIVTEGSAKHIVDNESYRIHKGDVFVISNDTAHGYSECKNFKICNIMFDPSFWLLSGYDIVRTAGFQALFVLEPQLSKTTHFCSRLKLSVDEYLHIFKLCELMHKEYTKKCDGWQTVFLSGFLRLTSELSRLYSFENIENRDTTLNLAIATAYIESNFENEISVSYLAKLSNYSERQFIRVFKQTYNCKPTEYLRQLRVRTACRMLRMNDTSITEIAQRCGFGDSNYFSRVFRQETGLTPTQYRQQN